MSKFPQELAIFKATERILAEFEGDPRAHEAHALVTVLFKQCSAYHGALIEINELAKRGDPPGLDLGYVGRSSLFNVIDNLDQPI